MQKTLVLDQGYQPTRIVPWQRAITMWFVGKCEIVDAYDELVKSQRLAMQMPAVVRMLRATRFRPSGPKFSRLNVMTRDGFRCQYCGTRHAMRDLTYDHVLPRSRGGPTSWTNVVTACRPCNHDKGDRTPAEARMTLARPPFEPKWMPPAPPVSLDATSARVPDPWKAWVPIYASS
jgi:5-methylcytosine-specific restriction endonuclease McrA